MLFCGRILVSIAMQLHASSIYVYISETSHPNLRSSLVILPSLFVAAGLQLTWLIMPISNWRITAFVLMIPTLSLTILMFFLHETPYWLIQYGKVGLARRSLQFFRGNFALE